jgi:penicillin-binding protein 1A
MNSYLKILLAILTAGGVGFLVIAALFIGAYYYVAPTLPNAEDLRNLKMQMPLEVYSRDGRLMAEFGEFKRTPVAYEEIPQLLIDAVLAAEDDRFFEHPGVDYQGVLRAAYNEIVRGDRGIGGSTITQQVARTTNLVGRERRNALAAYIRKFKEQIVALRIEREFSKEEILELYLNTNPFSHASYGVVTAARTYFGKELRDLTVSEAAILAGIPNGPSIWNPISSPQGAMTRRAYVLRRMREINVIDDEQYREALAEPITGKRYGVQIELQAPYVAEMVRAEMIRRFGEAATTTGLKVTTTIDSRLQLAANNAIRRTLVAYDERHGYRGALARVDLSGIDLALPTLEAEEQVRDLFADYPDLLGYETGLVLSVDDVGATVYLRGRGRQTIALPAVEWAAPFITDDEVGAKPTAVAEVLAPGDVVRFRTDADGNLRLGQIPEVQGAFVSVDPQDGAVVSLTGGLDFFLSKYNRAVQARRQPGSAFKPFVYSAALDNGFNTASIINDAPPDIGYDPVLERVWKPENFGGRYYGLVRLRNALAESMNAASIRVMQQVGVGQTVDHVRRFGFDDTAVPQNLSLALGAGGVAPLDLVSGFATFANGGYRIEKYFIQRIETAAGEVLYEAMPAFVCKDEDLRAQPSTSFTDSLGAPVSRCAEKVVPSRTTGAAQPELVTDVTDLYAPMRVAPTAISPQNAHLITDMLQDVIRHGTGARAQRELGRSDLAGKTGTTNDGRDTWFVGFSRDVVAAAWVGFDQDRPLGGREQGGITAIPMWIGFMAEALDGVPQQPFRTPPGIVEVRINPESGLVASDANPYGIFEKFDIDNVPEREPDPVITVTQGGPLQPGEQPRTEPIF